MNRWIAMTAAAWSAAAIACGAPESVPAARPSAEPAPSPAKQEASEEDSLLTRGKQAYMSNCIACHNINPELEGGLGPPVSGASRELLEARILRGEYPEGYIPKRDTRAMVPLPYLEKDIDALALYLSDGLWQGVSHSGRAGAGS